MAASRRRAEHAIRQGAMGVRLGVGAGLCLAMVAAPARAAGLAERIISAESSRSGTVYWSFNSDGSDRRQVLRTTGGEVLVRSGDGRRVLALEIENRYGLHLARVDGRQRRVLQPEFEPLPSRLDGDGVALSPDGTKLAALVRHIQKPPFTAPYWGYLGVELVAFDADGGNRRVLIGLTRETSLSNLQWAPDGRELAFVREPFSDCGQPNGDHPDCTYTVELVPADGSGPARVVARVGRPFGGRIDYELSPNGRRIAYASASGKRLIVAGLDGSHRRTLTRGVAGYFNWSPDGRKILYAAGRPIGPGFYAFDRWRIVTVSSGRIVRFPNQALVTQWSPDGRQLLGIDGRRRGLLLYRPDGRVARDIPGTKRDVLGGAIWEGGRRL